MHIFSLSDSTEVEANANQMYVVKSYLQRPINLLMYNTKFLKI